MKRNRNAYLIAGFRIAAVAASVLLTLPVSAADSPAPGGSARAPASPAWEKIGDSDGIAVFRREVPGSPIMAFKGEGVVDASILRVATVLLDNSRATEWVDSLAETRVLKQISEFERVVYHHIKTPAVLTDRDFVINSKMEFDPAQKKVTLRSHSVDDPGPTTDYVRGRLVSSSFTLTALDHGTKTRIVTEVETDPKGNIPKWVANMFQKRWPHNTISRLRAQAAKTDVNDSQSMKDLLTAKGYFN